MSQTVPQSRSRTVPERVVTAVADAKGVGPTDLEPLHYAIDPDSLDSLFRSGTAGAIVFSYEGCEVTVDADGDVSLAGV